MRKIETLTLSAAGATQQLKKGSIAIPKGKKLMGLRCKVTIPVKNTSGGAAAMSDTERQALLALLACNVKWGRAGKYVPFSNVTWARMQRIARMAYGSELEGYSNSTDGLATSMANNATTNETFYFLIPLGKWAGWRGQQNRLGMGRTQARSLSSVVARTPSPPMAASTAVLLLTSCRMRRRVSATR
jgi:hypothetical protein